MLENLHEKFALIEQKKVLIILDKCCKNELNKSLKIPNGYSFLKA